MAAAGTGGTNGALALPYWINSLLFDSSAGLNDATLLGSAKTFKYFFPSQLPTYYANTKQADGSFVAFSEVQKARALAAFDAAGINDADRTVPDEDVSQHPMLMG